MTATDAEQDRARRALLTSGLAFTEYAYGFFVRGPIGNWMAPAEVLAVAKQGRLR